MVESEAEAGRVPCNRMLHAQARQGKPMLGVHTLVSHTVDCSALLPDPPLDSIPWHGWPAEHAFEPGSEQHAFIERDLAAVDRGLTPWVVLGGHRPVSCGGSSVRGRPAWGAGAVVACWQDDLLWRSMLARQDA
jgi:hypothetical protein